MKIFIIFLLIGSSTFANGFKTALWGETKSSVQKKLKSEDKEKCSSSFLGYEGKLMDNKRLFLGMRTNPYSYCSTLSTERNERCIEKIYKRYSIAKVGPGCGIFFDGKYVGQTNSFSINPAPLFEELKKKYGLPISSESGSERKIGKYESYKFKSEKTEIYAIVYDSHIFVIYYNSEERDRVKKIITDEYAKIDLKNSKQKEKAEKKALNDL